MKLTDSVLLTPEENIKKDEALLDEADRGLSGEHLRFWESDRHFVVLGYSKRAENDVDVAACERDRIPILKRSSGGGTVLQGPGCLNYALILDTLRRNELSNIKKTNCFIMQSHRDALSPLLGEVAHDGLTDLSLGGRKFSGNAQRRKRNFCLFHGTFLLDMKLDLIEKYLRMPEDRPAYRGNREHRDFLTNIPIGRDEIKRALIRCWKATA